MDCVTLVSWQTLFGINNKIIKNGPRNARLLLCNQIVLNRHNFLFVFKFGELFIQGFFFGMLFWFETQKRFVLHWSWMMIILQIYNNDWLEIVVYTERTGTIEIEFVAKKILIFFKFFLYSNFFFHLIFLSCFGVELFSFRIWWQDWN